MYIMHATALIEACKIVKFKVAKVSFEVIDRGLGET